ncbi:VC0807 family protein [Nocardia sp. NPDC046473]|uniref:VC0807 family protein n=1 Tax=Nocardia sp. NPDC046473 TaxID=3155733 RepID=UPI0033ED21D7
MTMTNADTSTVDQPTESSGGVRTWLAPLARDIAVPVGAYFAMHALGYSDFAGLLAGTVLSAAMLIFLAIRSRRLEVISAIVLCSFVVGLVLSLVTGDARLMIAKDSVGTVLIGLAFLISAMIGKPLIYLAARKGIAASGPAKLAEFEAAYRTNPDKRRAFTALSVLWGGGLLGEGVLRVVLAYQLPVHTMAWLSPVLMICVVGPLFAISMLARKRGQRA